MNFAVRVSNGGARTGVLQVAGCPSPVETPALVLSTRKGLPTFITKDLLDNVAFPDSPFLKMSPLHFTECPLPKTILSLGGLHQLVGLHNYIFLAAPRDSITCHPDWQKTNRTGASFDLPSCRRLLKPNEYMEMIRCLKPNIWCSMADEVPACVTEKRNAMSVDRTVRWLDECISLDQEKGASLLGAVVGGSSLEQRRRSASEVAKRNVAGYTIGGFGLGEDMVEHPVILKAIMELLPKEKVRHICGIGMPEEILQGVAAGIDLFDTTYIYQLTIGGFALVYSLDENDAHFGVSMLQQEDGDRTKIDLRATIYRKDTSPLVEGCTCYSCQHHTRAYINHLLNVHEMLAHILLEIHNTHHYLAFFRAIRQAIKQGTFEAFRQKFIKNRRSDNRRSDSMKLDTYSKVEAVAG